MLNMKIVSDLAASPRIGSKASLSSVFSPLPVILAARSGVDYEDKPSNP